MADLVSEGPAGDSEAVDSAIEAVLPEDVVAALGCLRLRAKGRGPVKLDDVAGGRSGFDAPVPHDDGLLAPTLSLSSGFL